MFKHKTEEPKQLKNIKEPETIIGPSVKVEGNFKGDGDIIVNGQVKGSLKTKKNLKVGEQAVIKANIQANNAYIAGYVQGNVSVKERLELTASARITGDITAKLLQINTGAIINGLIKMEDELVVDKAPDTTLESVISIEPKKIEKKNKKKSL